MASGQDSGRGTANGGEERSTGDDFASLCNSNREEWNRRADEYWRIGKPLFPPDEGQVTGEEDNNREGRQETMTEDEQRERVEEIKRRLKAVDEACKFPVSERSKEENRRREAALAKEEEERRKSELVEMELSAIERRYKMRQMEQQKRAKQKEVDDEAESTATEMEKKEDEDEEEAEAMATEMEKTEDEDEAEAKARERRRKEEEEEAGRRLDQFLDEELMNITVDSHSHLW